MKTNQPQKNIPSKWQQVKLGGISQMGSGGTPKSTNESYFGGDILWVSIADMTANGKYIYSTLKNLSKEGLENSSAKIYPKNTILYAMYASIGECSIAGVPMTSSQAILGIIPNKERLDSTFLYFYLCSVKEKIKLQGQQGTQSNLNAGMVKDFKLKLPPLSEQNRIVSVLETWDKIIENFSKKIEIKKQIKKGLMQDLLTGKKRLFGFKDNWKFVNLGETCKEIKTGKLDANAMVKNGKYRFYTCAKDYYFIDNYAFDTEALLVSGNGANVGYVHYYKGKFNAYQRTYVLCGFTQNIIFIKYILDLFLKTRIKEEVREGNTPYITMDTLTDMNFKIPSIKEQDAIAEILTISDKEITELEKKLEIVKDQKKYLLNNLITGVIRTPENLSVKS